MAWKEAQSEPACLKVKGPSRDEEASGGASTLEIPEELSDHRNESAQEAGSTLSESIPFKDQLPAPWTLECPWLRKISLSGPASHWDTENSDSAASSESTLWGEEGARAAGEEVEAGGRRLGSSAAAGPGQEAP